MSPDMAFFIGTIDPHSNPNFDLFILARSDHERRKEWIDLLPNVNKEFTISVSDWLNATLCERLIVRLEKHTVKLRQHLDPYNYGLLFLWNHLANLRFVRGRKLLEKGSVVISDRLHVYTLSILFNKPHVLIDDKNGKISNYHKTWSQLYRGVVFVNDLRKAVDAARSLDAIARSNG